MAFINDIEIWIDESGEKAEREVEVTTHPVEEGIDTADMVRRKGVVLQLSGEIVGPDATEKMQRIEAYKNSGAIVKYQGRYSYGKMWITKFDTTHTNKIWGGYQFDMTLQEARVAKSAIDNTTARKDAGMQQAEKNSTGDKIYYTVKAGDSLWNLVDKPGAPYRENGFSSDDVMKNNPEAFGRAMDPRTLRVGAKLWIGNRKG